MLREEMGLHSAGDWAKATKRRMPLRAPLRDRPPVPRARSQISWTTSAPRSRAAVSTTWASRRTSTVAAESWVGTTRRRHLTLPSSWCAAGTARAHQGRQSTTRHGRGGGSGRGLARCHGRYRSVTLRRELRAPVMSRQAPACRHAFPLLAVREAWRAITDRCPSQPRSALDFFAGRPMARRVADELPSERGERVLRKARGGHQMARLLRRPRLRSRRRPPATRSRNG